MTIAAPLILGLFASTLFIYFLEGSVGLTRIAGDLTGKPASGPTLQASLAFVSRFGVLAQTPLLAFIMDRRLALTHRLDLCLVLVSAILTSLAFVYITQGPLTRLYRALCSSVASAGTYFSPAAIRASWQTKLDETRLLSLTRCKSVKRVALFAIPYLLLYASLSVVLQIQTLNTAYSAVFLSVSTIMNGFGTAFISLFIDPRAVFFSGSIERLAVMQSELFMARVAAASLLTAGFAAALVV